MCKCCVGSFTVQTETGIKASNIYKRKTRAQESERESENEKRLTQTKLALPLMPV